MRDLRVVVALLGIIVLVLGGTTWANRCPPTGPGYELNVQNDKWRIEGYSHSEHTPNDHAATPQKMGNTGFIVAALRKGHVYVIQKPDGRLIVANDAAFVAELETPFFNGSRYLAVMSPKVGSSEGVNLYSALVGAQAPWTAAPLRNSDGTFSVLCSSADGQTAETSASRKDPYHAGPGAKGSGGTAVPPDIQLNLRSQNYEGPFDDAPDVYIEDERGGSPGIELDAQGEIVLGEDGYPILLYDESGALVLWELPQVTTRLSSSVRMNADGTITYTYNLENLTAEAIPFRVAQVPVNGTPGWSGTVAANDSEEVYVIRDAGEEAVCFENARLELKVNGADQYNEIASGRVYVPASSLEYSGTCVITNITFTSGTRVNHVGVQIMGGPAQKLRLFRESATTSECITTMTGDYAAGQTYTIDSPPGAPVGIVTYFVTAGIGVNSYTSGSEDVNNP